MFSCFVFFVTFVVKETPRWSLRRLSRGDCGRGQSGAIQELRSLEPRRIRIIRENHAAPANGVDDLFRDGCTQRGASPAPTKPSVCFRHTCINVRCAVDDDGAIASMTVEPRFEPLEPKRVSVVPDIGISGAKETETRFTALHGI